MRQIEILRASYVLQLLILSTGTHFQHVSEHYVYGHQSVFVNFDFGEKGQAGAQYNSTQYGTHKCFVVK